MATASSSGIIILDDDDDDDGMSEEPGPSGAAGNQPPTPPQANGDPGQKPTITGKDPASLKAENQRLFTEFLEFCSQHTQEHSEVIPFLDSRHQKTSPDFLASAEFRNVLGRCLTRVQAKRSKVYVYINELCTVLKAHSQKKKLALSSTPQQSQPPTQPPDSTTDPATLQPEAPKARAGSKRQICYLENLLRVYVAEIQRLQERELDLSELDSEDSAYLQESRLKRRMMRIFERLCELKACSSLTGRVIEQRIPYRGTRYPEVNRRIERFINRPDVFPDYNDILKVIQKASACHELGLPKRQMQSMAADAFREVGNRLQERRHLDLVYNFGSHLTDQYQPGTDPALADAQLSRRLRHNRVVAMNRLNEVISRYAHLQDESEEEEWRRKRAAKSQGSSSDPHLPGGQAAVSKEPSPVQTDKEGSPSVGGAQQSASEEEDEDEASSETDIEAELQESQEGGEEEEEPMQDEDPPSEEAEGDQRMDPGGPEPELLPYSSAGEELDDEEEEEENEDGEEATALSCRRQQHPSEEPPPASSPGPQLFVLEIETLPLEPSETPPPSPRPSEAVPSPPPPLPSWTEHGTLQRGEEEGSRTCPLAKRRWPLENGDTASSVTSCTDVNGAAEGPGRKRSRQEPPISISSYIEVPSEEGEGGGLALQLPRSPAPKVDSTRADSPGLALVTSSSQGSPQPLDKNCKTSVATQCDPEEIIILSDSD